MFKHPIAIAAALAVLGATVPAFAASNPIIPQSLAFKPMTHAKAAHIVARGAPAELFMLTIAMQFNNGAMLQQNVQAPLIQPGFLNAQLN